MKKALATIAICILFIATTYSLAISLPPGQVHGFKDWVSHHRLGLFLWRLLLILGFYLLFRSRLNAMLRRDNLNARQRQFLVGLRWQVPLLLLLLELGVGQHGISLVIGGLQVIFQSLADVMGQPLA
jgi:hypothetical protein